MSAQAKQIAFPPATATDWGPQPAAVQAALDQVSARDRQITRTVWVNQQLGSDLNGSGSRGRPYATISKALSVVNPVPTSVAEYLTKSDIWIDGSDTYTEVLTIHTQQSVLISSFDNPVLATTISAQFKNSERFGSVVQPFFAFLSRGRGVGQLTVTAPLTFLSPIGDAVSNGLLLLALNCSFSTGCTVTDTNANTIVFLQLRGGQFVDVVNLPLGQLFGTQNGRFGGALTLQRISDAVATSIEGNVTVTLATVASSFGTGLKACTLGVAARVWTGPVGAFVMDAVTWAEFIARGHTFAGGATLGAIFDDDTTLSAEDITTGDVSTASAAFVDLLRVNAGTAVTVVMTSALAGFALVDFFCALSNTGASLARIEFQILLNGVAVAASQLGVSTTVAAFTSPLAIRKRVPIVAGINTWKVQWRTSAGTAQIRTATVPNSETGTLIVQTVRR